MKPFEVAARNVRLVRHARVMTQQDLADRTGIDRSMWAKIERGARRLSVDELVACAAALDVSVLDLLNPDLRVVVQ